MKLKRLIFFVLIGISLCQTIDRIGSVSIINGICNVENVELSRTSSPLIGNSIFNYDIISSGPASYCEIAFDDNGTRVRIDDNSIIKIIVDRYSRTIKLMKGSVFLQNAKTQGKTYIKTIHNNVYINNNEVWVYSTNDFDQIFSLKSTLNIYNEFIKSNIELLPLMAYYIYKNGDIQFANDIVLPYYVIQNKNNRQNMVDIEPMDLFIVPYDLIPDYKALKIKKKNTDNGFYFDFVAGTRSINSEAYLNIGFIPTYKNNNFIITANLDFYFDSNQKILKKNWLDKNSFLEKIDLRYKYSDYQNSIYIKGGNIGKVSFAHGYLVNKISNSFDYPFNNFGIDINYKLDNDFMKFRFLVPSVRDYFRGGGVLGMHSSIFLSHKFPLTLGFGIVFDMHQFSHVRHTYAFPDDYSFGFDNRQVTAAEFDFNFNLIKRMDLDVSLYGEFVGMWYPDYIHYIRDSGTGDFGSFSKVSRKGTWGVMSPGIAIEIDNRHKIKFALNYNSAGYQPSYFNTNYLYNRSIYCRIDEPLSFNNQNFIMLTEQIDMLNSFAINEELTEFILPKEIYPMIINQFNASPINGFTIKYDYQFKNKANFSAMLSRYQQNVLLSPDYVYYTLESNISIRDGYLKNITNFDFYIQNIYFVGDQDKQDLTLGCNLGIAITPVMSLILDLSQVYYDSDFDGDMVNELNFGLSLGANF
tara:strand:+ start:10692 stop:12776 length:2085 start_codon:yes stop_codon:yes gene_type:complete